MSPVMDGVSTFEPIPDSLAIVALLLSVLSFAFSLALTLAAIAVIVKIAAALQVVEFL